MKGVCYMHKATGLWLTLTVRSTHTGKHADSGHSTDINKAYVGVPLNWHSAPPHSVNMVDYTEMQAECVETRKVSLL
jgi:hypothetical protein